MFSFKKSFSKKCAIVFCLLFLISTVMTAYAGAAGGGGGGGSSSGSSSGGGGGSSRGSAGGGGGGSSGGGASGGGGGGSSGGGASGGGGGSSGGGASGGGGSSSGGGASGGGGGSSGGGASGGGDGSSDGPSRRIPSGAGASGGGGGADPDWNPSNAIVSPGDPLYYDPLKWDSIEDFYKSIDGEYISYDSRSESSSGSSSGQSAIINRSAGASGGGSGSDTYVDATKLEGYVPTEIASVTKDNKQNMAGVMFSNGNSTKFVITSKDGVTTSEYLKDWAVLTTDKGSQGWFHFDDKGDMSTGFINDSAGNTYYMLESGDNKGMMAVGTVNINGVNYNFSDGSDGLPYGALVK